MFPKALKPPFRGQTKSGPFGPGYLLLVLFLFVSLIFLGACIKNVPPGEVVPEAGSKDKGVVQEKADDQNMPVLGKTNLFPKYAADCTQACYFIEEQEICLSHGYASVEAAPGSATKIETSIFGDPDYGDLNGDGIVDVVLVLLHQPGGSGTFYYVTAALQEDGKFRGTNAVFMGDRISPQAIDIRNGVVNVNYADRKPDESMATEPSIGKTRYLVLKDGNLTGTNPTGEGELVVAGWVTIGHEMRAFVPCEKNETVWISGDSAVLGQIVAEHRAVLPDRKRYAPLFMVLAGRYKAPPLDGFGAEYEGAFSATQLIQVWPKGNCKSDVIVVDEPTPGAMVTSPLRVRGRARGSWFFEGDFPIVLKNHQGETVAKGFCTAQGEWMTTEFVPFQGTLEFNKDPSLSRGTLVIKKDNPTDRPELDNTLEIPVAF